MKRNRLAAPAWPALHHQNLLIPIRNPANSPGQNIFFRLRNWPKTSLDFAFAEARFMGISARHRTMAEEDSFWSSPPLT
jgi:hypothetical protein